MFIYTNLGEALEKGYDASKLMHCGKMIRRINANGARLDVVYADNTVLQRVPATDFCIYEPSLEFQREFSGYQNSQNMLNEQSSLQSPVPMQAEIVYKRYTHKGIIVNADVFHALKQIKRMEIESTENLGYMQEHEFVFKLYDFDDDDEVLCRISYDTDMLVYLNT